MLEKTAIDYKLELLSAEKKVNGIKARIEVRLKELCKAYPDVLISNVITNDYKSLKSTNDIIKTPALMYNLSAHEQIQIIELVEIHLNELQTVNQLELDIN
jgi:hypothetical protein